MNFEENERATTSYLPERQQRIFNNLNEIDSSRNGLFGEPQTEAMTPAILKDLEVTTIPSGVGIQSFGHDLLHSVKHKSERLATAVQSSQKNPKSHSRKKAEKP